jgi:hypothetical protein
MYQYVDDIDWDLLGKDLYSKLKQVVIETVTMVVINHVIHWVVCKIHHINNNRYDYRMVNGQY